MQPTKARLSNNYDYDWKPAGFYNLRFTICSFKSIGSFKIGRRVLSFNDVIAMLKYSLNTILSNYSFSLENGALKVVRANSMKLAGNEV